MQTRQKKPAPPSIIRADRLVVRMQAYRAFRGVYVMRITVPKTLNEVVKSWFCAANAGDKQTLTFRLP